MSNTALKRTKAEPDLADSMSVMDGLVATAKGKLS